MALFALSVPGDVRAGTLTVTDLTHGLTPNDLANMLAGNGVTISNVTYTGALNAAGEFSGGTTIGGSNGFGFDSGVALSTGSVQGTGGTDHGILGPNDDPAYTVANGTPGDADLDALVTPSTTFDAAVLEFDVTPTVGEISFRYVFGSEEYNEFVDSQYDDVFGFFVNGHDFAHDCATVPGPNGPERVSINTVNDGESAPSVPPSGPGMNANLFVNNDFQSPAATAPYNTQLDGFTVPLTCDVMVPANQPSHVKLAIADTNDEAYDSDVLIEAHSVVAGPQVPESSSTSALALVGGGAVLAFAVAAPVRRLRLRGKRGE